MRIEDIEELIRNANDEIAVLASLASSRAKAGDKWRREGPLTVATHGAASKGLENHRQRVGAVMATITRVGKGKVGHVCLREGSGKQSSKGRRQVAS